MVAGAAASGPTWRYYYPIGREVRAEPGTSQSPERVLAAGTLAELGSRNDRRSGCQPEFVGNVTMVALGGVAGSTGAR